MSELAHWLPRPAPAGLRAILRELGAACGLAAGGAAGPPPDRVGQGRPVLLIPGFLAGDWSLAPLSAHLAAAGFAPLAAGIPFNVDCGEATMARLERRVEAIGAPVAVVGHSRGGMLARVLARRRPDLVSRVVTLATPYREPLAVHPLLLAQALAMGAGGTLRVPGLVRYSCAVGRCCAGFRRDLAAPAAADCLSVYSRRDGIVDWRACVDGAGRSAEVWASHCAMPADPATQHVVTRCLAAA